MRLNIWLAHSVFLPSSCRIHLYVELCVWRDLSVVMGGGVLSADQAEIQNDAATKPRTLPRSSWAADEWEYAGSRC